LGPGTVDITFSEPVTTPNVASAELFDCGADYACDAATDMLVARYDLSNATNTTKMDGRVAKLDLSTVNFKIVDKRTYKLVIAAGSFEDSAQNAVGETVLEFRKDTMSGFARANVIGPSMVAADGYTYAVQMSADTVPGAYTLCYCDGAADVTLQDLGDQATSYVPSYGTKRASVSPGDYGFTNWGDATLNDHICETKCRTGCVGDDCFCGEYSSSLPDMDSTYCLSSARCRAACDAETNCTAISTMGDTFCLLSAGGDNAESDAPGWTSFLKRDGSVCTHPHDFSAAVGSITVTSKVDVGTEYVVPPSETLTIEVSGTGLLSDGKAIPFSADRIMVVDCDGQCGYSGPSASVSPANWHDLKPDHWAVDAPAEMPGDDMKFKPSPYSMESSATGVYETVENVYLAGANLNIKAQPDIALEGHMRSAAEHLCYQKCLVDECTGADCFCDGAYSGYDDEDSNSICGDQHTCEMLCDALEDCSSIDMHVGINRCFLNGPSPFDESGTEASDKYHLLVKLTDETELRRLKDGAPKRSLLDRVDPGTSHPTLLRYKGVTFSSGGSFKVCFCDSSLLPEGVPCSAPSHYGVEVGEVQASGISCLLTDRRYSRKTCVPMLDGGLRCYDGEAPDTRPPRYAGLAAPTAEGMDEAGPGAASTWCTLHPEQCENNNRPMR